MRAPVAPALAALLGLFGSALHYVPVASQEIAGYRGTPAVSEAMTQQFRAETGTCGYTFVESERFILGGTLAPAKLVELAALAEKVWLDLARRFAGPQGGPERNGRRPKHCLVFFDSRSDCFDSWEFLRRRSEPWIPGQLINRVMSWGQANFDEGGIDLIVGATDHPSFVINSAAWSWIHDYAFLPPGYLCIEPSRKRPGNLKCFLSDWAALSMCGRNSRTRVFASSPPDSTPPAPSQECHRESVRRWASERLDSGMQDRHPGLAWLFEVGLNHLGRTERALGVAFIDYCVQARPGALEVFLRCVRRGWDFSEAFHQTFDGLSEERFFAAFKDWIAAAYA